MVDDLLHGTDALNPRNDSGKTSYAIGCSFDVSVSIRSHRELKRSNTYVYGAARG
jgi:hypothetical protein